MQVNKGLVIAEPWLAYILGGSKSWEMRSSQTSVRGYFALIRKGSGAVWGVANLTGVGWALSPQEMLETVNKHCTPADMIRSGEVAKWNVPWILSDVRPFARPVPYEHPSGAVTWVNLVEGVSRAIAAELDRTPATQMSRPAVEVVYLNKTEEVEHAGMPNNGGLIAQTQLTEGNMNRPGFTGGPNS